MTNRLNEPDVTLSYGHLRTLISRAYANLEFDEDWPTNEELGGHRLLGTRDDELKFEAKNYAEEVIDAYRKHEGIE